MGIQRILMPCIVLWTIGLLGWVSAVDPVGVEPGLSPFQGNHEDSCVCQQSCADGGISSTVIQQLTSNLAEVLSSQSTNQESLLALIQEKLDAQPDRILDTFRTQQEAMATLQTTVDDLAAKMADLRRLSSAVGETKDAVEGIQTSVSAIQSASSAQMEKLLEVRSDTANIPAPPSSYRRDYRVFHVRSRDGTYRLTLAEARSACSAEGAVLATPAQLEAARQLGLSVCACGWLEDGSSRFPYYWPHDGCGGKTGSPRVVVCQKTTTSTFDAYCYKG